MSAKTRRFLNEPRPRTGNLPVLTRGCPLVRYRSTWCMGLCEPVKGMGLCGELAPHSMLGKTQKAIRRFKKREELGQVDQISPNRGAKHGQSIAK